MKRISPIRPAGKSWLMQQFSMQLQALVSQVSGERQHAGSLSYTPYSYPMSRANAGFKRNRRRELSRRRRRAYKKVCR